MSVETLKERLDKRNAEIDGAIKRDDDFEATLKRVSMENINLKPSEEVKQRK